MERRLIAADAPFGVEHRGERRVHVHEELRDRENVDEARHLERALRQVHEGRDHDEHEQRQADAKDERAAEEIARVRRDAPRRACERRTSIAQVERDEERRRECIGEREHAEARRAEVARQNQANGDADPQREEERAAELERVANREEGLARRIDGCWRGWIHAVRPRHRATRSRTRTIRKSRVANEIATPEPARLAQQSIRPLEARRRDPSRRSRRGAREKIERRADAEQYRGP